MLLVIGGDRATCIPTAVQKEQCGERLLLGQISTGTQHDNGET